MPGYHPGLMQQYCQRGRPADCADRPEHSDFPDAQARKKAGQISSQQDVITLVTPTIHRHCAGSRLTLARSDVYKLLLIPRQSNSFLRLCFIQP